MTVANMHRVQYKLHNPVENRSLSHVVHLTDSHRGPAVMIVAEDQIITLFLTTLRYCARQLSSKITYIRYVDQMECVDMLPYHLNLGIIPTEGAILINFGNTINLHLYNTRLEYLAEILILDRMFDSIHVHDDILRICNNGYINIINIHNPVMDCDFIEFVPNIIRMDKRGIVCRYESSFGCYNYEDLCQAWLPKYEINSNVIALGEASMMIDHHGMFYYLDWKGNIHETFVEANLASAFIATETNFIVIRSDHFRKIQCIDVYIR